ncbi:MAG: FAD-dependent monooxygenase, partial [Chloroflexota bacterium]|nr:FAD-dependent monooxygenase [Chloroflexota bacterium]
MPERAPASFPREREAEVIVVGGGPAGSTVATTLAEAGHRVLLLDKAAFPRHKACSEYINPAAAQLLCRLGLGDALRHAGAHRMAAMLVHAPDGRRFVADFARAEPGQAAFGLSRYRLDHLLLERAKAAGVTVRERAHVRQVVREGGRVVGVAATINGDREWLRSSLVIGADGHNSVVSRELGLDTTVRWPRKTGLVAHYRGVTGLVRSGEMHVASGLYAGLAPLEDGLTNVAVVAGGHAVTARSGSIEAFFTESLRAIPAVARKLDGAERVGGIRGAGAMARRARRTAGAGYLLIGDAASFLDPFTGDGIYEALRAAQLAAPVASAALRAGDTSA